MASVDVTANEVALIVIAKAPVPGRVKTRLCPPFTHDEAAALASAALRDTLDTVLATPARRRILALAGRLPDRDTRGFDVVAQRGAGLDERLTAAFEDSGGPAVLVGMDTPQVTPDLLAGAAGQLVEPETDAVLGRATDGGWWVIGLRHPDPRVFRGIATSVPTTGAAQLERLQQLELRTRLVETLTDVDDAVSAAEVARSAPTTRFARALARLSTGVSA